jgi:CelD/BcsL family acetyltransferase involved in cellulose biosynthesis
MLETVILDSTQDFAALEEEWEDLYCNAPLVTPFQSWAWLYSWWEAYGEGRGLRLVMLREESLLVGLLPLMLERWGGFGRLLFIGTGPTDYQDVLAREGWEAEVYKVGAQVLKQMSGWQVVDLQQLHPEAAAWGVFENWIGPRTRLWQDNFPVMDVRPWDELLLSLSRNLRSTARRTIRRVEADGVGGELADAVEAEQAVNRWLALHREAWRGREITPEHLTRRFESYMQAAVRRMTVCGLGGISEFWRNGEVVASQFLVFGQNCIGQHLFGATEEVLKRYQVSALLIWDAVNIACGRGTPYLNFLRGEEPYKLRWSSRVIPNHRVILGRNLAFWSPYTGYHTLYSKARRSARLNDSRWVKSITRMFRTVLRSRH